MNNQTHTEPRLDERPFGYIVNRGLLHRKNEGNNAVQCLFASPEYRITIEHGSIRIEQETDTRYKEPGREL